MSWPASWVCFYCGNPINELGHHVFATIRHHYFRGGSRESERRFHAPCFGKFSRVGRPYNPKTDYEVLVAEGHGP